MSRLHLHRVRVTRRTTIALVVGLAAALAAALLLPMVATSIREDMQRQQIEDRTHPMYGSYRYEQMGNPGRTVVYRDNVPVATFTDGARTVVVNGVQRKFVEPGEDDYVVTQSWVRLAPRAWKFGQQDESWFRSWFTGVLDSGDVDVLGVATQYVKQAPALHTDKGLQYAGDAGFGPLIGDERDQESDFYDYLGVTWTFPDGQSTTPEAGRLHDLDCSGFIRMVYGYRMGITLFNTNSQVDGLPRRAYAIAKYAPAVTVFDAVDKRPSAEQLVKLQPGDLLFFALHEDPSFFSHSAIYLGRDGSGHMRFISSRSTINGPTLGDVGGDSILDGKGYFAVRLRKAIRL